jgi:hypothetical protein
MNMVRAPLLTGLAAACFVLAGPATAADGGDDRIDPDRPGVAEGSSVVGKGRVQLEMGVQQEHSGSQGSRERTLFVPTLVRVGVTEKIELRLEGDTYTRRHETLPGGVDTRSEGMAPSSIGVKLGLREGGGSQPSTAAILRYFPRSGSGPFKSSHATGDLRLAADWELSPQWSLNPNVGVGWYEDDAQRRYTSALVATTLGYDASSKLNLFVDTGMHYPESRNGGLGALVDVGAAYRVDRDLQLDLSVGARVAGSTFPRRFVSLGFSRRF